MQTNFEDAFVAAVPKSTRFQGEHECPRAAENGRRGRAAWMADEHCSYCGSLNPDVFMERIEAGTVELGPTTKNYKVYVQVAPDTELFRSQFRGEGDPGGDDPAKWVWTTEERTQTKFYFQHLSLEQKRTFIEILNSGKLKFAGSRGFNVLPFFVSAPGRQCGA
ncbi:MAG: hypothetical protein MI923_16055 [Phycisphaerales bacterium]|nr:hypothetical protein [Phycisphaerales bacterium]